MPQFVPAASNTAPPRPPSSPGITPGAAWVLHGVTLLGELVPIRTLRRRGEPVSELMEAWLSRRSRWWAGLLEDVRRGARVPLAVVATRLGLSDGEVDLLLLALSPRVDPEMLRTIIDGDDALLVRSLTLDASLSLRFHTTAERFAAATLMGTRSRLVQEGMLLLEPVESDPGTVVIRVAESFSNYLLDRPLVIGPVGSYCEIVEPTQAWNSVVMDEDQKECVWEIVAGQASVAQDLDAWGCGDVLGRTNGVVVLLAGPPGTGKSMLADAIALRLGRPLLRVSTARLAASRDSIRPILDEVFRIGVMSEAVLLLDDCETFLDSRDASFLALLECLDRFDGILVLTTNAPGQIDVAMERRIHYRLDCPAPGPVAREEIWQVHLPPELPTADDVDTVELANAYEFSGAQIRNTVLIALARLKARGTGTLTHALLREAADRQLRSRLDELADRSTVRYGFELLVLPDRERRQLDELLAACKHREFVMSRWGFASRLPTGRGLCVLFDGPPGTGKTLTAELLAGALKLPVHRVQLPNIVSKWVGETERNIALVFARARATRSVLLFDEADALFGRRTANPSSSNDRYANMEVNLLLQEIERYDGITVLTTNLVGNLDEALQRRIQFRVSFPTPGPEERARIWEMLMSPLAPVASDVDYAVLGRRFDISGGYIKNALLKAAYNACAEGTSIHHRHLWQAATRECEARGMLIRDEAATSAVSKPGTLPMVRRRLPASDGGRSD